MNIPRNESRKENLLIDLKNKENFLEKRKGNLQQEIENVGRKIQRLEETRRTFELRLKELKSLEAQNKKVQETLKEVKISQPLQETREERLQRLYRDFPVLKELKEEDLPSALTTKYNL